MIAAIGSGAAGSWLINNLGLRQSRGDFAPGFMIEHMAKVRSPQGLASRTSGVWIPYLLISRLRIPPSCVPLSLQDLGIALAEANRMQLELPGGLSDPFLTWQALQSPSLYGRP